ncbi:MAG TPA: hypothetical protein DDZ51_01310 [Planctomycetaceae bacterium]|nr:hypothetical protein [Planctomycetaceae bacterium]
MLHPLVFDQAVIPRSHPQQQTLGQKYKTSKLHPPVPSNATPVRQPTSKMMWRQEMGGDGVRTVALTTDQKTFLTTARSLDNRFEPPRSGSLTHTVS